MDVRLATARNSRPFPERLPHDGHMNNIAEFPSDVLGVRIGSRVRFLID
jgi:hypothetical protein